MQTIDNYTFTGKKAIIRVDFNVPIDKNTGEVSDDTRIRGALPTINKILNDGGACILMSHLGRPKGRDEKFTLKPVVPVLEKLLGKTVKFAGDCLGGETRQMAQNLQPGEVLLLENVRFYPEEEAKVKLPDTATEDEIKTAKAELKEKQRIFAQKLSEYADVFVNDAFGTAHRAHGTTAIIADYFEENSKMFGYLINAELEAMEKALSSPRKPFTAIMGGAKVSDKIMVIENLLDKIDNLLIGGGMNTFIRAKGGNTGNSICEEDKLDLALEILKKAEESGVRVFIPADAVNGDKFEPGAATNNTPADETPEGWMGMDIGEQTIKTYSEVILNSATILWNGPMGVFEFDAFSGGTLAVAKAVAEATSKGAYSVVGGGDSVSAVNKSGLSDRISHVSTGGGAMLEYLEGQELPGIKAVKG